MSLKLVVPTVVIKNFLKPKSLIAASMCFLMDSSYIPDTIKKKELLFSSTGTSWIALFIFFLMSSDLRIY